MTFAQAIKELDLRHPVTGKPITAHELIDFLKEDVIYAATRPGSWEGANMLQVFFAHGFLNHQEGHLPH